MNQPRPNPLSARYVISLAFSLNKLWSTVVHDTSGNLANHHSRPSLSQLTSCSSHLGERAGQRVRGECGGGPPATAL